MIEGKQIFLRAMEPDDMECFRAMINDPAISHVVVGWSFPVSKYEQMKWYESAVHDKKNLRFTIVLKETGKAVGMVTLSALDWQNRSASHGIKLSSECPKGQGIATDAVMTLMKYAFEEMGLHRLNGGNIAYNKASEVLYLKCGWSIEGVKKEAIYRSGKYHDLLITGILEEDYYKAKERLGW